MGDLGLSEKLQLPIYDSPGGSTDQRFRILPDYFGACLFFRSSEGGSQSAA